MREIKFRAWDGDTMYYSDDYEEENSDWNVSSLFEYEAGSVFQQFTGLFDKNNTPIYEGDILEVYSWGMNSEKIGISSIIWDEDNCGWRLNNSQIADDFYDERRAIRKSIVIGNVFQNNELLNNE